MDECKPLDSGALGREPGSNLDMESSLRFVLKVAPALGVVGFLCATEVVTRGHCPPATSSTRILKPRLLSCMASFDVVHWGQASIASHVIDTYVEPSRLAINGIM